jgi:catechol 2,3-dioxygenase-like lactoylglutathione lyase family enzyme
MKRIHMHVAVEDLQQSIQFYNTLFGAQPSVEKPDYAKWMLDDPRLNFAISQRGGKVGLDHVGIQVESAAELSEIQQRVQAAELSMLSQDGTTCCYAKSDKHWLQDPSGLAWEAYRTLESAPTFNLAEEAPHTPNACCAPSASMIQFTPRKVSKPHE